MRYNPVFIATAITVIGLSLLLRVLFSYVPFSYSVGKTPLPTSSSLVFPSPVPTKIEEAPPATVTIPKLSLTAQVERISVDDTGMLGVPVGERNVGWLGSGPKPGEEGNALMDGHYDLTTGAPGIFYSLHTLQTGDIIHVTTINGKVLQFTITNLETYPSETFPFDTVLAPTTKKKLILITCTGQWDSLRHEYPDRLVIYSELSN